MESRLEDVAEIIMGQSPKGEDVNQDKKGTPLLNGPTEYTDRYPIPVQFTTNGKKFSEIDDILFCVRGSTTGRINIADQKYAIGRGVAAIRGKNGYSTSYVEALINKNLDRLLVAATGSTFPNVSRELLENFVVEIVEPEKSTSIGNIQKIINSKIYTNSLVNNTLESIAQTLFKSWFVEFDPIRAKATAKANGDDPRRAAMQAISGKYAEELQNLSPENRQKLAATADVFPDELLETEHGAIPIGWEWKKLGEVTSFLSRGLTPKYADEGVMVINQRCIRNHSIDFEQVRFHDENQRPIKSKEVKVGDVLVNSTGVGTLGRVALVKRLKQTTTVDTHVTIIRADSEIVNSEFLGYFMLNKESLIESMGEGSTGQTELKRTKLQDMLVCIPNKDIQDAFSAFTVPMINNISMNELESMNLQSVRDTLVPKLLSGDLKI